MNNQKSVYDLGAKVYSIYLDELGLEISNTPEQVQAEYDVLPQVRKNMWAAIGLRVSKIAVVGEIAIVEGDNKRILTIERTDRDSQGRLVLIAKDPNG